ncbi:MAG: DUF368 domain-containing protein [Bacteroidales bacterium]
MNKTKKYTILGLKGIGMGAANVIPGVSGGTIALLTGIYQELIDSIKAIDGEAIKLLFTGKFHTFWKKINGDFLIMIFLGVIISLFTLAKLMTFLMSNYPIPLWAFFFGLIIISAIHILKGMGKWKFSYYTSLIIGISIGLAICLLSPGETTNDLWFIFLCGAIAICTMILPGISGSFILLLMGKYEYILDSFVNLDGMILVVFCLGAIIGLVLFAHLLSWLLKRYYNQTICFLSGIMLGSLLKVWPWQKILPSGIEGIPGPSRPITPSTFSSLTTTVTDPMIWQAIVFCILGIALVAVLEYLAKDKKTEKSITE